MHYWGGGVERWVHDIARADPGAIHLTFASYRIGEDGGQRFALRTSPSDEVPARTWDLAQPLRATSPGSAEYRRLLGEVIEDFCVDSVVVSSLIGHSLDALETGKPTLVVMHDLYPACQAINPRFRGLTCQRCTREELSTCREENPLNRTFVLVPADDWMALRKAFVDRLLRARPALAVPSRWVAQTLKALEPRLQGLPMRVIGHGIDERPPRLPYPPRLASERLRLAVVGRMSPAKGPDLLAAAAAGLAPYADVWLVGEGKASAELARQCGWRHVGGYTPETLGTVLAQVAPHAALLPSVVPETFGYALSELLNLGVVPLATQLGSFAERIRHGHNGFLFEPDPHHLAALVRTLHDEPERLADVAARLAQRAPEPTTGTMVAAYRPWLPVAALAPGRYRVGVGRQTGLSEPYRHLSQAFSDVQAAYEQTDRALAQTQGALQHVQAVLADADTARRLEQSGREAAESQRQVAESRLEVAESRLAAIRSEWAAWMQELHALRLSRRPWLAGRAWSRLRDGRIRLEKHIHDSGDDKT
jgi:glycosyltransferase involved in cell wall biosynthesis